MPAANCEPTDSEYLGLGLDWHRGKSYPLFGSQPDFSLGFVFIPVRRTLPRG